MIYLASRSPRRRQLLALAEISFEVIDIDIDESPRPGEAPAAYAQRVAREKAAAGWDLIMSQPRAVRPVLAADTVVALGGRILGKPVNAEDARMMLRALSGRLHSVYTAVVVRRAERAEGVLSESTVQFAPMGEEEVERYVATGEPLDKAGAYAVQGVGQQFIERVEGSVSGIMGLPLYETVRLLRRFAHE